MTDDAVKSCGVKCF